MRRLGKCLGLNPAGGRTDLAKATLRLALCGLLTATVAACSGAADDAAGKNSDQKPATAHKPQPPACPQVAAVRNLAHYAAVTAADAGRITPGKTLYIADFGRIASSCDIDDDQDTALVNADIEVVFHAGAALPAKLGDGDAKVALPYFVAAIGPGDQILTKQAFTLNADLRKVLDPDNSPHEPVRIALPKGAKVDQILIGFQLSPEQLAFSHNLESAPHGATPGPMPRLPGVPPVPGMPNGRSGNQQ